MTLLRRLYRSLSPDYEHVISPASYVIFDRDLELERRLEAAKVKLIEDQPTTFLKPVHVPEDFNGPIG